jgi:exopolysaccharide biosynthesis protein
MKSKKMISVFIAALALMTTACTQIETKPAVTDNLNAYSAVVTADEDFKPKANDKFVWYNELLLADQDHTVKSPAATKRFIENQIEAAVRSKKYNITEQVADADYMIGAAVILDNSEMSQQVSNFVQVFPGIRDSIGHYKEGTILVVITKPGDIRHSKILWRGAIQAYVLGEKLTDQERQLRVQAFIQQLMNSFPVGE